MASKRPRQDGDVRTISEEDLVGQILDSMGVSAESAVVPLLIEVMHSYASQVLSEAHDFAGMSI